MNRRLLTAVPLAACVAGCEKDLVGDSPDAAVDAVPLPPGNFSCVGVDWPSHVRDPFPINGGVNDWYFRPLSGATAEVYDADTKALLGTATSSTGGLEPGKWSVSVPTGGNARKVYRKASLAGRIDTYAYDAFPEFQEFRWGITLAEQTDLDALYTSVGMTPDPSMGVVWIEVWDCGLPGTAQIKPIAGATIEGPPGSRTIYWDEALEPTPSLTSTVTTGEVAGALIVGVPPGPVDVVVTAGPLTYRSWPVEARANTLTISPRHP